MLCLPQLNIPLMIQAPAERLCLLLILENEKRDHQIRLGLLEIPLLVLEEVEDEVFTPSIPNKTKWNGNTRTNLNTLFPPPDERGSAV